MNDTTKNYRALLKHVVSGCARPLPLLSRINLTGIAANAWRFEQLALLKDEQTYGMR